MGWSTREAATARHHLLVHYDSGAIEIKGRFVVNIVEIPTGGVFSVALRVVPIA